MTLKHLLVNSGLHPAESCGDAEITGIQIDSRKIEPRNLFICMPDMSRPSEAFIPAAAASGASAALVYSREGVELAAKSGIAAALIPHREEMFQRAIADLCATYFEHPTRDLKLIGVTGTNGKTTTAWIIRDILTHLGHRAGYLGTLGIHVPGSSISLENTTPFAVDLYNYIVQIKNKNVDVLSMEVSSHALAQHRVDGLEFDVSVLTNLTQDHLDFHGTMEAYAAAKHRLFTGIAPRSPKRMVAAFNVDDEHGLRWSIEHNGPSITYAVKSEEADLRVEQIEVTIDRLHLRLLYRGEAEVIVPLGGAYNVENLLSAVSAVIALGYGLPEIASTLGNVRPVPGRFETIQNETGVSVLVDYAHTPDAIEKLLDSVRPLSKGRIITVFGCGGDRDPIKRPLMAKAASQRSDLTIVTSDNPRTEDPQLIITQVAEGIAGGAQSLKILDREEAISEAIKIASPGDLVLIAGKGHEDYQIIGRKKIHLDDREIAKAALGRKRSDVIPS